MINAAAVLLHAGHGDVSAGSVWHYIATPWHASLLAVIAVSAGTLLFYVRRRRALRVRR